MKTSAGLAIFWNKKVLLVHPTNAPWSGTYSIPKGHIEENEDILDTAIRETFEEVGIKVSKEIIGTYHSLVYLNIHGKATKRIAWYPVYIKNLSDIGLETEIVPKSQLQLDEVDWAGFLDESTAIEKMLFKQQEILEFI